jgi:adenylate kinase
MLNVILFGPPGSGKGTQAEGLVNVFGLKQISTGALVRKQIDLGTDVGKSLADLTARGDLVPDDVVTALLRDELSSPRPSIHGFIFDGYPRTLPQVRELQRLLEELHMAVDMVIELRIPDEKLIERVSGRILCAKCGATYHERFSPPPAGLCVCGYDAGWVRRPEDNAEALKKRLERYHTNTREVLSIFARHPHYRIIDATLSMDAVGRSIRNCINALED